MTASANVVWVVKGEVTDPDCQPGSKLGDVEWQFSNGPPGQRNYSADYVDLNKGLAEHADCVLLYLDTDGLTVHGGRPDCAHQWVEWDGVEEHEAEPVYDVCVSCGGVKQ